MKSILTAAIVVTLAAAGAAWADSHQGRSDDKRTNHGMMQGDMMRGGMKSMMGMMHRMMGGRTNGSMSMDDCAAMMRDTNTDSGTKPNDQWRKER